jgi:hypothetical protein
MWFRFKVVNDGQETFTAWQEETVQYGETATATVAIKAIRAANPNAAVSIERTSTDPNASTQ